MIIRYYYGARKMSSVLRKIFKKSPSERKGIKNTADKSAVPIGNKN